MIFKNISTASESVPEERIIKFASGIDEDGDLLLTANNTPILYVDNETGLIHRFFVPKLEREMTGLSFSDEGYPKAE